MPDAPTARTADAPRRALCATEVIVDRRLIRRRAPAEPVLTDTLAAQVAGDAHAPETVWTVLLALAAIRPDVLTTIDEAAFNPEEDEED